MSGSVYCRSYEAPPVDRREILRYAGVRGEAPEPEKLLERCLAEVEGRLTYKVCYCECAVTDGVPEFLKTDSEGLKKHLSGCGRAVLFAATVGVEPDRLIARYAAVSPTKSLLFQAIGAERIEALCDQFCEELAAKGAAEGFQTTSRFSPGYGDLPLSVQPSIFALLDCPRKIGLTLNESLLMSPSKSVTAIVGLIREERDGKEPELMRAAGLRG